MRAISLACALFFGGLVAVGCGGGSTPPGPDGGPGRDAGGADGGPGIDAAGSDGGPGIDAGGGIDAGSGIDAASDGGAASDAGPAGTCTSTTECAGAMEYCHTPDGMCSGNGVCETYDPSTICPLVVAPVCGCDGNTYDNSCMAAAAGQSIASNGMCGTCTSDSDCTGTEFCDFPAGACSGTGTCTSRGIGRFCVMTCAPECGCDGVTYTNACHREQAGTSLASTGTCPGATPPCTVPAGCCATDTDCGTTGECVPGTLGSSGRCETKVAAPGCWRDADCTDGRTCMGANVCPCGAACLIADSPGTCG